MGQESGLIVSVSGIRGVVGTGLTPEAAVAFAEQSPFPDPKDLLVDMFAE